MAQTPEHILKEAILLEMKGKAFYQNVAEKSDSEAARKIFQMMADEEDEHILFLSKQFQNYKKNQKFEKPAEYVEHPEEEIALKVLTEQLVKETNAASFEASAISAAMDFEKRAVKLYKDRAEEAVDPFEKELYTMLYKWEMGHEKALHEMNEMLREDIWNDNNFWAF
jgi:rubrerythrin